MNDTKKLTAEQSRVLIRYALTIAQKVCHERFCDAHPMGQAEVCKATMEAIDLLEHYDTTVRKEAREAAFKESADYIRRQWLAAYPVEVFPEPPPPPAECSRDVISAATGRHMATKLIEHLEAAANTQEGGGDG